MASVWNGSNVCCPGTGKLVAIVRDPVEEEIFLFGKTRKSVLCRHSFPEVSAKRVKAFRAKHRNRQLSRFIAYNGVAKDTQGRKGLSILHTPAPASGARGQALKSVRQRRAQSRRRQLRQHQRDPISEEDLPRVLLILAEAAAPTGHPWRRSNFTFTCAAIELSETVRRRRRVSVRDRCNLGRASSQDNRSKIPSSQLPSFNYRFHSLNRNSHT